MVFRSSPESFSHALRVESVKARGSPEENPSKARATHPLTPKERSSEVFMPRDYTSYTKLTILEPNDL
jgi:hypothetical protein